MIGAAGKGQLRSKAEARALTSKARDQFSPRVAIDIDDPCTPTPTTQHRLGHFSGLFSLEDLPVTEEDMDLASAIDGHEIVTAVAVEIPFFEGVEADPRLFQGDERSPLPATVRRMEDVDTAHADGAAA